MSEKTASDTRFLSKWSLEILASKAILCRKIFSSRQSGRIALESCWPKFVVKLVNAFAARFSATFWSGLQPPVAGNLNPTNISLSSKNIKGSQSTLETLEKASPSRRKSKLVRTNAPAASLPVYWFGGPYDCNISIYSLLTNFNLLAPHRTNLGLRSWTNGLWLPANTFFLPLPHPLTPHLDSLLLPRTPFRLSPSLPR